MSILESFKLTRDVASVFSLLFPPAASCIYSHCQRHGLAAPHDITRPYFSHLVQIFCDGFDSRLEPIVGDGHDKPFCTKAITIIDNFKKALGGTDNR